MNMQYRGSTHYAARPSQDRRGASDGQRDRAPTVDLKDLRFDGQLSPQLFSDVAERIAQAVAAGASATKNKASQLRRFYDEFVMWQEKVGNSDERFQQHLPFVMMLKAKVAYAKGRDHVDQNFEAVLRHLLDQCTSAERLRLGKLFFEAFMAFYKVYNNK